MLAIRPILAVLLVIGSMALSLLVSAEVCNTPLLVVSELQEESGGGPEDSAQQRSSAIET